MKLKRWFAGAVVLAAAAVAGATPATASHPVDPAQQSLRTLGQRHDLYIGTAVDMAALADTADPQYRATVSKEFSTVTAENVMKWESLEPTRGTYNFGPADELIAFAKRNNQKVRGHVLVWHNQLPAWLTTGVSDGSISKAELRDILRGCQIEGMRAGPAELKGAIIDPVQAVALAEALGLTVEFAAD